MVHLDFLPREDAFDALIHFGHGRRNNEPTWSRLCAWTWPPRLGFRNVEIRPFEEADGTLAPDYACWRFPWTLIAAQR